MNPLSNLEGLSDAVNHIAQGKHSASATDLRTLAVAVGEAVKQFGGQQVLHAQVMEGMAKRIQELEARVDALEGKADAGAKRG